jgi:hypothetical protein
MCQMYDENKYRLQSSKTGQLIQYYTLYNTYTTVYYKVPMPTIVNCTLYNVYSMWLHNHTQRRLKQEKAW